jgi:hypothetical protein
MSEMVTFPTKLSLDNMTAEEFATDMHRYLVAVAREESTERLASAFRALEGEICDLALMGDITKDLAGDLINKAGLPREADRLFFAVEQLAKLIGEFRTRYYRCWNGAEPSAD